MITKTNVKSKNKIKVKFVLEANSSYKTVELLGLNNDWQNGLALKKRKDGAFYTEVELNPNESHSFKYRINGDTWLEEPVGATCGNCDCHVDDGFGGKNSVIHT